MDDRELRPDSPEAQELFASLEREMADQIAAVEAETFEAKYGFEHNCTCAADYDEGRTEMVAACYLNMVDESLAELRRTRAALTLIALSETAEVEALRALAAETVGIEVAGG